MKRKDVLFLILLVVAVLILYLSQSRLHAAGQGTLKVTATYTGKGTVDQQHKIYVMVFDANPFTSSTLVDATEQRIPPAVEAGVTHVLAVQSVSEKQGTVSFYDVPAPTVYVIALFDKNGEYTGRIGSFSEGEPLGVYGNLPDKLEPIKLDRKKTAQITLTFDDSHLTP